MTADSPELRGVWGKDELLAPDVHLPCGVNLERLQDLSGERAMKGWNAVVRLGQIARELHGDDVDPLADAAYDFVTAVASEELTAKGFSSIEIGAMLAVATQPPPEQDPAGQRFRRIKQFGRRLIGAVSGKS